MLSHNAELHETVDISGTQYNAKAGFQGMGFLNILLGLLRKAEFLL
jgi:hypothetical protein